MQPNLSDLRVPKRRLTVEILLLGDDPRAVEIFLADYHAHAWRRQEVSDLLSQEQPFLPCREVQGSTVWLVNKEALVWVRVPAPSAGPASPEALFLEADEYRQSVQIQLAGNRFLTGELRFRAPAQEARVLDHLNSPERYLSLWSEPHLFLVQKRHVQRLTELETIAPQEASRGPDR
jgi:hypothetical protein